MRQNSATCAKNAASSDEAMTAERPLVSVVDDDESVRESLPDLIRELGYEVEAFSSAEAFLKSDQVARSRCLILDVFMPGLSGPDLMRELRRRRQVIPVIFMTGEPDPRIRSRVIEHGAIDCLFKPFGDSALHEALKAALETSGV
jgi:FixJ family two-component response regulator